MKAANLTQEILSLRPTLRLFTYRFTHDREESQDLLQDTMLKALTYKHKYTADTNLKGWLFTIMRNTFINNYRKAQRSKTIRDNTDNSRFLNIEDTHTFHSPASTYEYTDIWKNVNEVKDEFSIPFKMHISGYKYEEIAEHLQLPIGTVKNRIFHARKEIQKKLKGYSLTSTKGDE
jgi:RNA polymerase sigma-70 factor (ECF subfamily)